MKDKDICLVGLAYLAMINSVIDGIIAIYRGPRDPGEILGLVFVLLFIFVLFRRWLQNRKK